MEVSLMLLAFLTNVIVKRCDVLMNEVQSIQVALDKQTYLTKKQNRIRLNVFIDSVRHLLHHGLTFRGHDESEESKIRKIFKSSYILWQTKIKLYGM